MKSDRSIKNICIAAIKRHTIKPIDFPLSRIFEDNEVPDYAQGLTFLEAELPISSVFVDQLNWTLVTSRRIATCLNGELATCSDEDVVSWNWGIVNFSRGNVTTVGQVVLSNGASIKVHIEVGRASMLIIYAIMTLVGQVKR